MAINFGQNWQNDRYLFVDDQADVLKLQGMWQFQFKNIQWQYCSCIVCKYDQDRSSKLRDCEGNNCTFLDETAKIGISD